MQTTAGRDEDLAPLEQIALDTVDRLRRGAIDAARLARAQRELLLDWELTRSERGSLASQLGGFAVADEWRTLRAFLEARSATTTTAEIQRVARRYLVPWNQVIATTRRNPQPRAEATTTGTRHASDQEKTR